MKKVFFCPACGYAGDAPDRTRRCPKCGQKLSSMLVGEKTRSALTEGEEKHEPAPRRTAARNGVASLLDGMGYRGGVTLESPVMSPEGRDTVKLASTLRYLRDNF